MSTYLVIQNNGERKSYPCVSSAEKPYLRVADSYLPLISETTSGLGVKLKISNRTYRPIETRTSTATTYDETKTKYTITTTSMSTIVDTVAWLGQSSTGSTTSFLSSKTTADHANSAGMAYISVHKYVSAGTYNVATFSIGTYFKDIITKTITDAKNFSGMEISKSFKGSYSSSSTSYTIGHTESDYDQSLDPWLYHQIYTSTSASSSKLSRYVNIFHTGTASVSRTYLDSGSFTYTATITRDFDPANSEYVDITTTNSFNYAFDARRVPRLSLESNNSETYVTRYLQTGSMTITSHNNGFRTTTSSNATYSIPIRSIVNHSTTITSTHTIGIETLWMRTSVETVNTHQDIYESTNTQFDAYISNISTYTTYRSNYDLSTNELMGKTFMVDIQGNEAQKFIKSHITNYISANTTTYRSTVFDPSGINSGYSYITSTTVYNGIRNSISLSYYKSSNSNGRTYFSSSSNVDDRFDNEHLFNFSTYSSSNSVFALHSLTIRASTIRTVAFPNLSIHFNNNTESIYRSITLNQTASYLEGVARNYNPEKSQTEYLFVDNTYTFSAKNNDYNSLISSAGPDDYMYSATRGLIDGNPNQQVSMALTYRKIYTSTIRESDSEYSIPLISTSRATTTTVTSGRETYTTVSGEAYTTNATSTVQQGYMTYSGYTSHASTVQQDGKVFETINSRTIRMTFSDFDTQPGPVAFSYRSSMTVGISGPMTIASNIAGNTTTLTTNKVIASMCNANIMSNLGIYSGSVSSKESNLYDVQENLQNPYGARLFFYNTSYDPSVTVKFGCGFIPATVGTNGNYSSSTKESSVQYTASSQTRYTNITYWTKTGYYTEYKTYDTTSYNTTRTLTVI